jgi:RimJ/RimL family protein N-acetyltransferase
MRASDYLKYHTGMNVLLKTSRLVIREIDTSQDDLVQYLGWLQDTQNNSFIQSARVDYTLGELIRFIEATNSDVNAILFGLFLKENDTFIGTLKVQPIDYSVGTAWLGIMIGSQEFRGLGYGLEALEIVLGYLFNSLDLQEIHLGVDLQNLGAISLYRKLGFRDYKLNANSMFMLKKKTTGL